VDEVTGPKRCAMSVGLVVGYMENDRGLELQGPVNKKVTYLSMLQFCLNALKTIGVWALGGAIEWRYWASAEGLVSTGWVKADWVEERCLNKSNSLSRLKRYPKRYPNDTPN